MMKTMFKGISFALLYYILTLVAAVSLQLAPAWIVSGLVTTVDTTTIESAIDNRVDSIFQYQVWAGALLAACFALARGPEKVADLKHRVDFYFVVACSVLSFAIGFVHFEVIHYFRESGTYVREFDSNVGLLHTAQSALLMWSVFVFARLIWRSIRVEA
jgi:hypothetical protein